MVIAMMVVLASLGPISIPVTGTGTVPARGPWLWPGLGPEPGPGSEPILRHFTKATEPLALSSKAGGSNCEQGSACPLPKQPT